MDSPYLYCRQIYNGEESNINKTANFQVLDFSNLNNFSDILLFSFRQNSSVFLFGSSPAAPYSPWEVRVITFSAGINLLF